MAPVADAVCALKSPIRRVCASGGIWEHASLRMAKGSVLVDLR